MKTKFFLLLLIATQVVSAQTTPAPAQLTELINKAMDNYPKLKEASEYVNLSEAKKDLAYGAYMPVISGDANYRYGKPTPSIRFPIGNGVFQEVSFLPANNFDVGLKVQQPIWDFGRTGANVQKSKSDIATSKDDGASPAVGVSVAICESDATVKAYLIRNVAIPEGTTLSILRGQKLVLTSDTYLHVIVTSGDEIDITCSYLEAVGG